MTSGTPTPRYDSYGIYLSHRAAQEAQMERARDVVGYRVGMLAIQDQLLEAFPTMSRLSKLDVGRAACIIRLAGKDPRVHSVPDGTPYASAQQIKAVVSGEDAMWPYVSKEMVHHTHGSLIEVTVPSIFTGPDWGAAYARGLLEYSGAIAPSDDIMGDAERDRMQGIPQVLDALDAAQRAEPRLFIVVNGVVHHT